MYTIILENTKNVTHIYFIALLNGFRYKTRFFEKIN